MARKRLNENETVPIDRRRKLATSKAHDNLDSTLAKILSNLADLLVESGYAYSQFNKLTKHAFVKAAATRNQDSIGRISIARIAAATGLTRIEVSHLLKQGIGSSRTSAARENNRAFRVAEGWIFDPNYSGHRKRTTRSLSFASGKHSFSSLVKKYSGDIPARAMLSEMKTLGMVHQDNDQRIRLIRADTRISWKTQAALRAISPWIDRLWASVQAQKSRDLSVATNQLRLSFDSLPQTKSAIHELDRRRKAFIQSLAELGARPTASGNYDLEITFALATAKPTLTTLQRKTPKSEK